jgi:hypothetical protein
MFPFLCVPEHFPKIRFVFRPKDGGIKLLQKLDNYSSNAMALRDFPEFPIDKIYTTNKALRREGAWGLKINI